MGSDKKPELMLHDVIEQVAHGQQKLSEGFVIDLSGMEREVEELCKAVLELSVQERENYAAGLEQLYQSLSQFGDDLTRARDEIRKQIQTISSHRKANVAYKTADSRDDFGSNASDKEGDGES